MGRRRDARKAKKADYQAKTLREKKIDFNRHFRTYLVMSAFFVALNFFTTGSGGFWAIWPILGWGIGVAMQGMSLYGPLKDPEDVHPQSEPDQNEQQFGTPMPDLRERDQMELRELDTRTYRDEDLV
jgi:hypothetical protein